MKKNRSTLKDYFKKGAIPTEANFADLIDSMLNQEEDNINKLPNDPLRITASGADEALLNFYRLEKNEEKLSWQVKQKPGGKAGLSVSDETDNRLFIESASGKVGIGTLTPGAKLEVNGDMLLSGNNSITTRRGMLRMGTTDGSQTSADQVVGAVGFWGFGVQHGQLSFRAGKGFELVDRSSDGPSLDYKYDSYGYADLKVRNLLTTGNVQLGNSDIYFTKTDHNHSGFGNTDGYAAIENAKDYDALMILGRAHANGRRIVKLWDYLEVAGELRVTGAQNLIKVATFTLAVKNAGNNSPGKWNVDYSSYKFTEIYTVFVSLQGYSLWNNEGKVDFSAWGHVGSTDAIPQHTYVRVTDSSTTKASGLAYCSESKGDAEVDNTVLFTVVVMGRV